MRAPNKKVDWLLSAAKQLNRASSRAQRTGTVVVSVGQAGQSAATSSRSKSLDKDWFLGFLCEFVARERQSPHRQGGEALLSHSGALWPSLRGSGLLQPGSAPAVFPRCGAAIASACEQLPQAMSSAHAPKRARTEQGAAGPPPPAAERQAHPLYRGSE